MGAMFQQEIGMKIIDFYGMTGNFDMIKAWYQEWDYLIVGTAGFSPIPYKIFTITSGMFNIDFAGFVTVSFLSRGARFFLIAWILWRGGPELKVWIERNLYPLTMFAGIAIILAVVAWQLLK
jgi:membrane protein YqaA with SNARE-associated domain